MSYTTPITDRSAADIAAKNSKAFFNVSDWTRIYNNSSETNSAIDTALGLSIAFTTLTTPTNATIPTVSEINSFLANIERMRSALSSNIADSEFVEIKDDWIAGQSNSAPNYTHVNSWGKVIDIIYQVYKPTYVTERVPICGVAQCGTGLLRQNMFRG